MSFRLYQVIYGPYNMAIKSTSYKSF